jgi:hypothetical protein
MSDALKNDVWLQKVESPTIDRVGDGGVWRSRPIPGDVNVAGASCSGGIDGSWADLCFIIWTVLPTITGQQEGVNRFPTTLILQLPHYKAIASSFHPCDPPWLTTHPPLSWTSQYSTTCCSPWT